MLNQTDISYGVKGHNKFYVIQALEDDSGGRFYVFTRWGRVGVPGQNKLESFGSSSQAISNFEKKFKDKTKNSWSDRANFEHVDGKYDLIDMDYGNDDAQEDEDIDEKLEKKRAARKEVGGSKLDPRVQDLVSVIEIGF
jgi:poly [ADP-ribose] polymerase